MINQNLNFSFDSSEVTILQIKVRAYYNDCWLELKLIGATADWSKCFTNYINIVIKHRLLNGYMD